MPLEEIENLIVLLKTLTDEGSPFEHDEIVKRLAPPLRSHILKHRFVVSLSPGEAHKVLELEKISKVEKTK